MNSKRPFTPGFINKIDQLLLKNNPVSWSSRIHLALYYGLGFSLLVAVLSYIAPEDPRVDSTIYNWIILLGVISLLAFIFWLIYLLRFNVFKRFGKWNKTDTLKTFLLYFLITLIIVSWPYIPPIIQSIKANAAYTNDELVKDINDMNIRLCQLEKDSLKIRFESDTFEIRDVANVPASDTREYRSETVVRINDSYFFTDTLTLNARLAKADSIQKISDSIYVIYKCPDYQFIHSYYFPNIFFTMGVEKLPVMSSIDLYRTILQHNENFDKLKAKQEFDILYAKYLQPYDEVRYRGNYNSYAEYYENNHVDKVRKKYGLSYVNGSLNNIAEKKFRWDADIIGACLRSAYYISLVLALLILIYRHTTRKTFFLSLLTSVVLSILTGLFLATSYYGEGAFFTWLIIYFIIFAVISATIFSSRHRNGVSGISLNLLVFLTPFIPLVITAAYYSALEKYRYRQQAWDEYNYMFENESRNYLIAEVGGFILLLILLGTLYQMAYRKWYSAPEQ